MSATSIDARPLLRSRCSGALLLLQKEIMAFRAVVMNPDAHGFDHTTPLHSIHTTAIRKLPSWKLPSSDHAWESVSLLWHAFPGLPRCIALYLCHAGYAYHAPKQHESAPPPVLLDGITKNSQTTAVGLRSPLPCLHARCQAVDSETARNNLIWRVVVLKGPPLHVDLQECIDMKA